MKIPLVSLILFLFSVANIFSQAKWIYPVKPGSEKWNSFKTHDEKIEACQIPQEIIEKMSTAEMLEAWEDYPLQYDILAFNSYQLGFDLQKKTNHLLFQLLKRNDVGRVALEAYKVKSKFDLNALVSGMQKGRFINKVQLFELLLLQNEVFSSMTEDEKKECVRTALKMQEKKNKIFNNAVSTISDEASFSFFSKISEYIESGEKKSFPVTRHYFENVSYETVEGLFIKLTEYAYGTGQQNSILPKLNSFTSKKALSISGGKLSKINDEDDLFTPRGAYVPHIHRTDDETDPQEHWVFDVQATDAFYCNAYQNAVLIGHSTRTYNCYAYAWASSHGWIGDGDEAIYWSDESDVNNQSHRNSYIETSVLSEATRLIYAGGCHSALTIPGDNINITSKWRHGPVMRHSKYDGPYYYSGLSTFKYFLLHDQIRSGTLTEYEEWRRPNLLYGDIYVAPGADLIISADVDLRGHRIISTGGTITVDSEYLLDCAYIKQPGGAILGIYPTIQQACDNAGSGQWVMLQPRTYNESFSLSNKSSVNMQGNGSLLNGAVSLNNSSYCNIYDLHLSSETYMTVNGGVSNRLNNVQADNETGVLRVYNSTYFAAYGFSAPYGYNVDFAVSAYNSTGDVCAGSNIQSQLCGVNLGQGSRFNVTDNYFCGNDLDVYAEYDGSYAYVMDNTYSSVNPVSVYGNVNYIPDYPPVACSNSMMAKSSTFRKANGSSIASANEADKLYLELLNKMSKDELKDFSSLKAKYKSGYEKVISLSKDELRKSSDIKDFRSSLSRIVHSYKWLDEKDMLSSYLDELLSDSKLEAMSPYVKRYMVESYIDNEDFKGALALADEIMSSKSIDENLLCEMLYEKGIIYKHFLKDNSNAYMSFSKITGSYPNHALSKMAKAQLSDMPESPDKPYIKSLGTKSDEFKCSNYPNPFNPSTKFTFSIPKDGYTELKIYNSLGQEVKTLVSEVLSKGEFSFEWNANSFSSGIYYYTLRCGELVTSNKMILVK